MKFFAFPGRLLPILAAGILCSPITRGASQTVTTLARLGGDPNGYHPRAGLIAGGDGDFYGTTEAGGPPNCGTVYKVAPDGTLTTLYAFTGGSDGANPIGALVLANDGNFYGTTSGAGSGGTGTVFKITSAGTLTTIYSFSALSVSEINADGAYPNAGLIQGSDGDFYGTTNLGGSQVGGTVFRLTAAGVLTTLTNFDELAGNPASALVEGTPGNFYGVLPTAGASYEGSVYQITSTGTLTTLYAFTGASDGSVPEAALVKGSDGNFYGTTAGGGNGTVFKVTPAGGFSTLHAFNTSTEGQALTAPLIVGSDGNFYGTTGRYGPNGYGTAYQITPSGTLTVLASFVGPGGSSSQTNGLFQGSDGNFYGTAQFTGNGDAGIVFTLTPAGTLTTLHLFNAGGSYCKAALAQFPNGVFYGVTQQGGATGDGTIFGVLTSGATRTVHDFNAALEGKAPGTRLVPDGTGNYYGSCDLEGPNGGGTIYSVSLTTSSDAQSAQSCPITDSSPTDLLGLRLALALADESPAEGHTDFELQPSVLGSDVLLKLIYCTPLGAPTYIEGYTPPSAESSSSNRTLSTPDDASPMGDLATLYTFTGGADGSNPLGGVVTGTDGNYYGTTSQGGANGQGTVFSVTPDGALTTLHAFSGADDGAQPQAALVLGSDGNFYGTTGGVYDAITGVRSSNGTVFKITPAGVLTTLHTFASDGSEGIEPTAALIQGSDGNFYGTTSGGPSGTVFSITPAGTFTNLHAFSGSADGANPLAALIQGSDGNLYGTTSAGGTDNHGVVFRVNTNFHPTFFTGEAALSDGVYYLAFSNGNYFGYYSYLSDPHYLYHFDLGYEYVFDAADGESGVYLYDFTSSDFFYTSPSFPFPYLFDFGLDSVVYYYPDPSNPGHYNTDGYRFFYVFSTGQIIVK